MALSESRPYYPEVQEKFSLASFDIPTAEDKTLSNIYTPDGKLAYPYKELTAHTIRSLQIIPPEEEITIFDEFHPHENSSGQYHFEAKYGEYEIYAYFLPPGKTTSIHAHDAIEYYFLIGGTYTLKLDEEEAPLHVPDSKFVIVGPGVEHQGIAGEHGAMVVTVTHNPDNIPKGELHRYHDSWKKDWEAEKETVIVAYDTLKSKPGERSIPQ